MATQSIRPLSIRRATRHAVRHRDDARVEIYVPLPDALLQKGALLELSSAGLCFSASAGMSGVHRFALLEVVLELGGRKVRGDMLVAHVNPSDGTGIVCGGRFYPMTYADTRLLNEIVSDLDEDCEPQVIAAG